MQYTVNIDKKGLVRERSLVLEKGDTVCFEGTVDFSIKFLGRNPFGLKSIDKGHNVTEAFNYEPEDQDYWYENPLKGFPYRVSVGKKQTDPPVLKPLGPTAQLRRVDPKPPGPIILPPPVCPGKN
jgi:hypothetical protein